MMFGIKHTAYEQESDNIPGHIILEWNYVGNAWIFLCVVDDDDALVSGPFLAHHVPSGGTSVSLAFT